MHSIYLRPVSLAMLIAALACAAACTPALNWREVRMPPTRLQALLPCKPDEGTRTVTLAGQATEMHMVGCEAQGATYTLAWVAVPEPGRAGAVLGAWQDATLQRVGIASGPDAPAGTAFVPQGALALPQAVQWRAEGRAPEGGPVVVQAAWFVATGGTGVQAFQAAVYSPAPVPEGAAAFFDGLRLP